MFLNVSLNLTYTNPLKKDFLEKILKIVFKSRTKYLINSAINNFINTYHFVYLLSNFEIKFSFDISKISKTPPLDFSIVVH